MKRAPFAVLLAVNLFLGPGNPQPTEGASVLKPPVQTRYLAFQIFTGSFDSLQMRQGIPQPAQDVAAAVRDIIRAIGTKGSRTARLGFMVGPLAFDNTDDQVISVMRTCFQIALDSDIATGFHMDDSMFWGRLAYLNTRENIEWINWNGTPSTGRRLDWSSTPMKIMPQLCLNSPAVLAEVRRRAALVGEEVSRGIRLLRAAGKEELFMGVIAGWETQIGRDFDTGIRVGFSALSNKGYSSRNPPEDIDAARADIVRDFIDFWATSLAEAGVPDEKIYSHIAFMSQSEFDLARLGRPDEVPGTYLQTINFSPPRVAFGPHHRPGLSTYPQLGLLEQFRSELSMNRDPPWASSEGTAIDPGQAESGATGDSMENYLGDLFGHGAAIVNIFGWGVGPVANPFRRVAESAASVRAYREFLNGKGLPESEPVQLPGPGFLATLQRLQKELPPFVTEHGGDEVAVLYAELDRQLHGKQYSNAEATAKEILEIVNRQK